MQQRPTTADWNYKTSNGKQTNPIAYFQTRTRRTKKKKHNENFYFKILNFYLDLWVLVTHYISSESDNGDDSAHSS